jgi:hypothetical protein
MTDSAIPPRARKVGAVVAAIVGGLLLVAIAAVAWIGVRGAMAYGHLRDAQTAAAPLMSTLGSSVGDSAALASAVAGISADTAAARDLTGDAVWKAAEGLPWVGPQLAAVSTVSAALDEVVAGALTPMAGELAVLSPGAMTPQGGRIDTATFAAVHDEVAGAAASTTSAAASVDAIDAAALVRPLRDAVAEVRTLLNQTSSGADALARATALLPPMLGASGPRDYLVLFQNNAEWRSLGGIAGAMAVIHTDGGAMTLTQQDSAAAFPRAPESVLPLDPEIQAIYGQRPGQWMHNVTQVPDFALSGALAREMWARKHGTQVDGVIAIDPVALSYLLAATGPVTLPTGDVLTTDNAVQLLLNEVYLRYSNPAEQNAYFAAATAAVFDALATRSTDPGALLRALSRAGEERRLLMWSAHAEDQAVLEGTTLAGGLPANTAEASVFGVYLNDGTGSKMDYYGTADTSLAWDSCTLDAAGAASGSGTLTVTIANGAPADAASSLPKYITGGGSSGVPPGTARTVGYIYLPEGFELTASDITGDTGFGGGMHEGRRVLTFSADLAPGASSTATVTVRTTVPTAPTLTVQATPTVQTGVTPPVATCSAPSP